MSNRGNAVVLAGAIYARSPYGELPALDAEERIYSAVAALNYGGDERKADLYAQLCERLTATTTFTRACDIIEVAMDDTDRTVGRAS